MLISRFFVRTFLVISIALPLFSAQTPIPREREEGSRFKLESTVQVGDKSYNLSTQSQRMVDHASKVSKVAQTGKRNLASFGMVLLRENGAPENFPLHLLQNNEGHTIFFRSGEEEAVSEDPTFVLAKENEELQKERDTIAKIKEKKETLTQKLSKKENKTNNELARLSKTLSKVEEDLKSAPTEAVLASIIYTHPTMDLRELKKTVARRMDGVENSLLRKPLESYFRLDKTKLETYVQNIQDGRAHAVAQKFSGDNRKSLAGRYLHSEQLLLNYLNNKDVLGAFVTNALKEENILINEKIQKDHGIKGIAFLLHTNYMVCPTCSLSLFRENEMKEGVKNEKKDGVFSLLRKTLNENLGPDLQQEVPSALLVSAREDSPNPPPSKTPPGFDKKTIRNPLPIGAPFFAQVLYPEEDLQGVKQPIKLDSSLIERQNHVVNQNSLRSPATLSPSDENLTEEDRDASSLYNIPLRAAPKLLPAKKRKVEQKKNGEPPKKV